MANPSIIIGVDGGGTKTRAIAIDATGKLIGTGESGPSNPNNSSFEDAATNILAALQKAASPFILQPSALSLSLGIAGIATDSAKQQLAATLASLHPPLADANLHITHDLEIAHHAAFRGQPGIVLIAGTGSACYAITPDGQSHRASGRDFDYEDPGSGYAIGKRAINTQLLAPQPSRASIAALAPQVIQLAAEGDLAALDILRIESQNLAKLALSLAIHFSDTIKTIRIALVGSAITSDSLLRSNLICELERKEPRFTFHTPNNPPLIGALHLAWSLQSDQACPVAELPQTATTTP